MDRRFQNLAAAYMDKRAIFRESRVHGGEGVALNIQVAPEVGLKELAGIRDLFLEEMKTEMLSASIPHDGQFAHKLAVDKNQFSGSALPCATS